MDGRGCGWKGDVDVDVDRETGQGEERERERERLYVWERKTSEASERAIIHQKGGGDVGFGNVPRSVAQKRIYDILLTAHGCHQRVVIRFLNIRAYIYYIKLHPSI